MSYGTRKHNMYLKNYIDRLIKKAISDTSEVSLIKLTADDLANHKLSLIKNMDKTPKEDGNILSKDQNTFKDDKTSKRDKMSKDNTSIDNEPANKKKKGQEGTNGIDVLKLIISRDSKTHKFKSEFKSSLKPNKEIASTSTENEPILIDCEESKKSANSSATNVKPKMGIKDPKKMIDADNYISWRKLIKYDQKPKRLTNGIKKLAVAQPSTSRPRVNRRRQALNNKKYVAKNLIEIEKLYKKYFSKFVQDTIVIIANILNIILMSNKHHDARMDKYIKERFETDKLQKICDAKRHQLYGRHKKILESILKKKFTNVVSSFEVSEFDSAFKMFFLSILTVFQVLDQMQFKIGCIFTNLVHLIWNSLKNSEYNHLKIFSMFQSNTFPSDCMDLSKLIENSREIDPGVIDRMALFFVSTVNSRKYFQEVIDAVTGDSNEDLALLIDNAIFQYSIQSKFKNPVDSSTAQHPNDKITATKNVLSPMNSDEIIQHWILPENQDGTYHAPQEIVTSL